MSYGYFYDDDLPIFKQIYHCLPASSLNKPQLEMGDKIIIPASALVLLTNLEISFPMLFKLKNPASGRVTHCGVLEFTAKEGTMHLPSWMMENLLVEEGDIVKVKNVSLPAGTYMQLQPHTKNFLDITNPRAMLETKLRSFSCLTTGDTIVIDYSNKKFYIDIVDTKPSAAVCIIDTDCEVDFASPLDYEEAEEPKPSNLSSKTESRQSSGTQSEVDTELATKLIKFKPFTGSARRLDGKPITESVAVVSSSPMPQQPEDTDGTNGPTSSSSTTFQRSRKVVFGSKETPEAAPIASQSTLRKWKNQSSKHSLGRSIHCKTDHEGYTFFQLAKGEHNPIFSTSIHSFCSPYVTIYPKFEISMSRRHGLIPTLSILHHAVN